MTEWKTWDSYPTLRSDWDDRFTEWLEEAFTRVHEWEDHHCLLFVADAVEAQTGRDFAAGHRKAFQDEAGSKTYLKSLGFASVSKLLDSVLPSIPPSFAQRGDIVFAYGAPGVVIGGEALMLVHDHPEPVRAPRADWKRAWAVGRPGFQALVT